MHVDDLWFENLNEFLCSFPFLESLTLNGMKLGTDFMFLDEVLRKVTSVKLPMNGFSAGIGANLCKVMDLENLKVLDLGANWLGFQGIQEMKDRYVYIKKFN